MYMQANAFDISWQECSCCVYCTSRHVSAANLHNSTFAPHNLRTALASNNPDKSVWNSLYNEEYDRLQSLNVFTKITFNQYKEYLTQYSEKAQFIPTMNLFSIKPDMDGDPNRVKSRIVALGNLERRVRS